MLQRSSVSETTRLHRACLLAITTLLCATGCGMTGAWEVDRYWPPGAVEHFPVQRLTLGNNGDASAKLAHSGDRVDGRWAFSNGDLTLDLPGVHAKYDAQLTDLDLGLMLQFEKNQELMQVTLRRVD